MVRKLFSYLLVLATLLTSVAMPAYAEEEISGTVYEPTAKESLLMSLGLIDGANYDGDESMTRGEFAVLLAKTLALEIEDETAGVNSVPEVDDSVIVSPASSIFKDVDTSSDEYGAIMAVYKNGYMQGASDALFAPEYNLVLSEAIKVFIDLLGFADYAESQGGYPSGYAKVASSFSLYKGVSCGFNDTATKRDIASLLFNVMETPVAKVVSFENGGINYSTQGNETFMTEMMDIKKVNGVMTDNGVTALTGPSSVNVNQVICDGIIMNLAPDKAYARKYLGRNIVAYYSTADEDRYELVCAEPIDDAIVILEKDYIDFDNGVLKYNTQNGSQRTVSIGLYGSVIYNGVYTSSYTRDIFDITDGQITIVKKDSGYTVIIEDYKSLVVSKTDAENNEIYSKIHFNNADDGLNSVELDNYEEVCILDENGNTVPFTNLKEGDVLSCLLSGNSRYAEIILSTKKVEGVRFTSITADEYESEVQVYDKSDILKTATNPDPVRLGRDYTLYFSVFGTLVWIEEAASDEDELLEGILLKYTTPDYDYDYTFGVKIYTSNGVIKTYRIQKKFKLNMSMVKAERAYAVSDTGLESGVLYDLNVIGKPILYKEEDSVIKEIITPLGYAEADDQRGWYQITYDYLANEDADQGIKHIDAGNGASFGGLLSYDRATCNIYGIPHSSLGNLWDNKDLITINETEFVNHQSYRIEGYAKTKDAICADVMVHREKGTSGVPDARVAFLITDIHFAIDTDMEIQTTFTGYEFVQPGTLTKRTYTVSDDAKIVNESNVVTSKSFRDLEEGDIIRIVKNAKGEISYLSVSYDISEDKVSNTTCRDQAYTYKGYVMSVEDNGFKISARDEATKTIYTPSQLKSYIKNASTTEERKQYASMLRTYLADSGYPVVIVDTQTRKPTFTEASLDDVFNFKDTPAKYDTVVVCTHYLGGKMGAVVYR